MAVVKKEEEEEEEEEEESGMPEVEEGMLVAGMVVEGSDEAFSEIQVFDECFSADEESIKTELLARTLVNPALAAVENAVRGQYSRERFLRLRG